MNLILVGEMNINRSRPESAFANAMNKLLRADVLFGHLECPLTTPSGDPSEPDIPFKPKWVFSDQCMVRALTTARFSAVGCASNVMYGARAVRDTMEALGEAGIAYCGIGLDAVGARKPAVVEREGVRFGFLSYTSIFWPGFMEATASRPGVATAKAHTGYGPGRRALEMPGYPPVVTTRPDDGDLASMLADIHVLRETVDIVVVSVHWGISGSNEVLGYQREYAHAAIDAGADLVMGHGSHVPMGVEIYQGKPILYGLGNFAFDWYHMTERHLEGILVECSVTGGTISGITLLPAKRDGRNDITVPDPAGEEGLGILKGIDSLSRLYGTRFSMGDTGMVLEGIGVV